MSRFRMELARKSVHIGMGGFALALRWLTPLQAATAAAAAIVFNLLLLHRLTGQSLLREHEKKDRFSFGVAVYPTVVLALILVFFRRLELAAAVWALLAFGDGMATLVGLAVRGPKLPWNQDKSWAGLMAFILWGTAMSAFLIRFVQRGVLAESAGRESFVGMSFLTGGADGVADSAGFLLAGCFIAALVAGLAESARTGIDDNILVPVTGGMTLFAMTLVQPALLSEAWPVVQSGLLWGAAINFVLALGAYAARGVGVSGAVWGWVLGTVLYALGGWPVFLMLVLFFVLGTVCTKLGYSKKAALGVAQEKGGRRGAKNAFANVSAGAIFAFLAVATPFKGPFLLAAVAAFATAASDTVASEIGQAYGRRHFLVTTFRRVPAGTDGAVSIVGTLAGVIASLVLGGAAWWAGIASPAGVGIVAVAAFIGTTLESYLGAGLEHANMIDNELVNFSNTVAGGVAALVLAVLFSLS